MNKRTLIFLILLTNLLAILLAPKIIAQVLWDVPVPDLSVAQAYQYKLYVTPPSGTTPSSIITLNAVNCFDSGNVIDTNIVASCSAPIDQAATVGATHQGAQSQVSVVDVVSSSAPVEGAKSDAFIFQVDCSASPVKLNVGTWTRTLPVNGVGQVLYNLRQSTSNVVQVVISFNGMVQDTLQGAKLNNVAGSYFVASVPKGSYQLTVEATDNNGCKDGGASRPMTVTVQ